MLLELAPTTYLGDVDLKDGYTSIGTGGGDRAMSTLSLELTGDKNTLDLGTEGSYAKWEVENGTYEVTYKVYSSEDQGDRDTIYYWEDGVMEVFAERSQAEQTSKTRYQTDWMTSEVEVTDGQLMFMAIDEVDKVGSTQLRIRGIEKVASAEVEPEIQTLDFDPTPEDGMGAIEGSTLSTGNGSVSAEILTSDFFHDMVNVSLYGTEGTAALWVTEPGIQQITWSVSSTENRLQSDQFLLWDGQGLSKLGDSSVATTYNEEFGIYESEQITSTVNVVSDEWGILALDTGDTQGDSLITIHDLKWLSDGEAQQLPEPDRELLGADPDNEPTTTWQQQSLKNLSQALKEAFDKTNPKQFPKFKKKGKRDSFRYPQGFKIDNDNDRIFLPKIGWVRYNKSQDIVDEAKNVTVSLKGQYWFVSIQVEIDRKIPHPVEGKEIVGGDLGVASFLTLSNNKYYQPLNIFKKLKIKLAKLQRKLAKKEKFSNRWRRLKAKITKLHICIANTRNDYLHKISSELSKNHAIVILEDLKIASMSRSAKGTIENPGKNVKQKAGLNRAILDQGWGEFIRQLEYKLTWNGGQLIQINPRNTSRKCPKCSYISAENRKTQAVFCCQNKSCSYTNNADFVGSLNIREAGLALLRARGANLVRAFMSPVGLGGSSLEHPVKSQPAEGV